MKIKLKRGVKLTTPGFGGTRMEIEYKGPINVEIDNEAPRQEDGRPSFRITKEQSINGHAIGCYLYQEDTLPFRKQFIIIKEK